ncbi:fimbrial biogenesis chaperone [Chromobacterium phragmitis]|nr:molecular chaperone [Chromobacterium phragmitis]
MNKLQRGLGLAGMLAALALPMAAKANILLDRTRVIYLEQDKNVSMVLTNKNSEQPFLVQSWLSDGDGKRLASPFLVLPPLQRIEAAEKGVVRLTRIPDNALPLDRESLFYLNIQEIPPKSDKENVLQLAIKSRIKVFYRPKDAQLPRGENPAKQLQPAFDAASGKLVLKNPSPYYITLTGISLPGDKSPRDLNGQMVPPKGEASIPLKALPASLKLSNINDYGAQDTYTFACSAGACRYQEDKQ